MNATISMDGLWAIIDSLSLKNKLWLAEKLKISIAEPKKEKEQEILQGISNSLQQVKNGQTLPLESLWDQL